MYTFAYRRKLWPFKFKIHNVEGHSYNLQTDKMWIATSTGGREIRKWSECEVYLGQDWKVYFEQVEKERLERAAKGQ
jgi:hypothetical protein